LVAIVIDLALRHVGFVALRVLLSRIARREVDLVKKLNAEAVRRPSLPSTFRERNIREFPLLPVNPSVIRLPRPLGLEKKLTTLMPPERLPTLEFKEREIDKLRVNRWERNRSRVSRCWKNPRTFSQVCKEGSALTFLHLLHRLGPAQAFDQVKLRDDRSNVQGSKVQRPGGSSNVRDSTLNRTLNAHWHQLVRDLIERSTSRWATLRRRVSRLS